MELEKELIDELNKMLESCPEMKKKREESFEDWRGRLIVAEAMCGMDFDKFKIDNKEERGEAIRKVLKKIEEIEVSKRPQMGE